MQLQKFSDRTGRTQNILRLAIDGPTIYKKNVDIQRWVTANPAEVDVSDSLGHSIAVMNSRKVGALLVIKESRLVGIFSERDFVRFATTTSSLDLSIRISSLMTKDPVTAQVHDDYNVVFMLMKTHGVRHIPILDGEVIAGIVSIRDLTGFYQHTLETDFANAREEIDSLKELVHLSGDDILDSLFAQISRYKELSLTDHLTGLYNKRYFTRRLQEETARALRYSEALTLIFCDIDRFKRINDDYGHDVGDRVLRQVGAVLAGEMGEFQVVSRLRKSDIIARYGGEEFVIILPETRPEHAAVAAEKMRTAVSKQMFSARDVEFSVTMSFGIAGVSSELGDPTEFIRRADLAMYQAKENGRNRIEVYNQESDGNRTAEQ